MAFISMALVEKNIKVNNIDEFHGVRKKSKYLEASTVYIIIIIIINNNLREYVILGIVFIIQMIL